MGWKLNFANMRTWKPGLSDFLFLSFDLYRPESSPYEHQLVVEATVRQLPTHSSIERQFECCWSLREGIISHSTKTEAAFLFSNLPTLLWAKPNHVAWNLGVVTHWHSSYLKDKHFASLRFAPESPRWFLLNSSSDEEINEAHVLLERAVDERQRKTSKFRDCLSMWRKFYTPPNVESNNRCFAFLRRKDPRRKTIVLAFAWWVKKVLELLEEQGLLFDE